MSSTEGCVFCAIVTGDAPAHKVLESPEVVGFLDVRPLFKGHVLLVTRTHVPTLTHLGGEPVEPLLAAVPATRARPRLRAPARLVPRPRGPTLTELGDELVDPLFAAVRGTAAAVHQAL